MPQSNSIRTFHVAPEPHFADPAHLCPIMESYNIVGGSGGMKHVNPQELLEIVLKLKESLAYSAGKQAGVQEVLKVLGLPPDEYVHKCQEQYRKEKEKEEGQKKSLDKFETEC
jgi:hypothetical protein